MSPRERLQTLAVSILDISGITLLLKPFYAGRGAIIALHSVVPDDAVPFVPGNAVTVSQLRKILQFLKNSNLDAVHLSEIPERLQRKERFFAVTLDDGYRDNLENALPIFREFNVPFSVFPCTGFIARLKIPTYCLLEALCLHSDCIPLQHPERGQVEYVRAPDESPLLFFRRVIGCGWREADFYNALRGACDKVGLSFEDVAGKIFLSWNQLRLLAQDSLASIGVHTVTHASLASLPETEAELEVGKARYELEERLGVPVEHIAYPYGSSGDCGPREFRMAERMGFKIGVTTKRGNLHAVHQNSLHSLPRHTLSMAPHSRSHRYLRIALNGIWDSPLNGTLITR